MAWHEMTTEQRIRFIEDYRHKITMVLAGMSASCLAGIIYIMATI